MAWEELAPKVINDLSRDLNITPQAAAGIVGQLGYESEGLQAINERQPVVQGSRGGFGWAQWTGPRRREFESWAGRQGMDINTPEANYGFLVHELKNTPESRVLEKLQGVKDPQQAGRIFTDTFLRPGVPAYDKRASWTEKAMNAIIPAAQAGEDWWSSAPVVEEPSADSWWQGAPVVGEPQPEQPTGGGMGFMEQIGRQVALTGRAGLQGVGQALGVFTEPIRMAVNPGLRALGLPEAAPTSQVAKAAADFIGLPVPQTSMERIGSGTAEIMSGAGSIMGVAGALARGATGMTQTALQALASNPGMQTSSAMGAGLAGTASRESGDGPVGQMAASLFGGLAAPMALSGIRAAASRIGGTAAALSPQAVTARVNQALSESGVDIRTIPGRVRQQIEAEAARALKAGGDLDPAAIQRLSDFARINGATPSRGMLTQDPSQITREMNLAKQQAAMGKTDGVSLPNIQAQNNAALVRALDDLGASSTDDAFTAGAKAISSLTNRLKNQRAKVSDLYSLARDSQGRSFPLDGREFADNAIKALDDALVGGSLPADVRSHLNRISSGEVPFTVDYAEQLKTMMAQLQRGATDGNARYALGLVRQALDNADVLPLGQQTAAQGARAVNPGNLPSVPGSTNLGQEAVDAFNRARSAFRAMSKQVENSPALTALADGNISPDNFIQKFVVSPTAKVSEVQRLGRLLASDPGAKDAIKVSLLQHLKSKALGGLPDDIGSAKFSPAAYARALEQIGDRKLSVFFAPDEVQQLKALSRVGRLMVNQPIGSAVNNSNSGAAVLASVLNAMGNLGKAVKIFGVDRQIQALENALSQRSALNVPSALARPAVQPQLGFRFNATPASVYGALLSGQGSNDRDRN